MAPARKVPKKPKRGPKRVVRRLKPQQERSEAQEPPLESSKADRPKYFTKEVGERICDRMANGETPTAICHDSGMPTWYTLCKWRRQDEDFDRRFRVAWESCCEYLLCDAVDIADNASNDYVDRLTKKGVLRVFDREHFERSRLRVELRKWTASKVLRHVYGDKSEVDVRTPDGVNIKLDERNALIDAIVKLVSPKKDGETKPAGRTEEARER